MLMMRTCLQTIKHIGEKVLLAMGYACGRKFPFPQEKREKFALQLATNNNNVVFIVLSYYVSLRSEFRVVMSVAISAYKQCLVRLYLQLFVAWLTP